jgi:hypothetical protein
MIEKTPHSSNRSSKEDKNLWWLINQPHIFWNLMMYFGDLKCFTSYYSPTINMANVFDYIKMFQKHTSKDMIEIPPFASN